MANEMKGFAIGIVVLNCTLLAQSEKGLMRGPRALASRRLAGIPQRDPANTSRFYCNRSTCALHDTWNVVQNINNNTCTAALSTAMGTYGAEVRSQCTAAAQAGVQWLSCRSGYCTMYDQLVHAITGGGSNNIFGSECEPLVHFNKTICDHYYRDRNDFCGCICPSFNLLGSTQACETQIIGFLLLGRRGVQLRLRYFLDGYCLIAFCEWVEKIADPRKQVQGAPAHCLASLLPFQRSQCRALMATSGVPPYQPCPWETAWINDHELKCSDGYVCDVRTETWTCCQRHGYKAQCPKNFPVMCADPLECSGDSDHCCVETAAMCTTGVRQCAPLLAPSLIEWKGGAPSNVPAYVGPSQTTTFSGRTTTTVAPTSWGVDVMPYVPYILISVSVILVGIAILVCYRFGGDAFKKMATALIGAPRFLALYKLDIENVHRPEEKIKEYPPLPPKVSEEDIKRWIANSNACEALEKACTAAFRHGRTHLVSVHFSQGRGPQAEAKALKEAIAEVRARSLEDTGDNARLCAEGDSFVKTLAMETVLVEAMEQAFPNLEIDWQSLSQPPVPNKPWKATTVGLAVQSDKRNEAWRGIEELNLVIGTAKDGGFCSHGLIEEAQRLVSDLVARTPELPADRCVLDPEGQGVRLLPKGKQRAVWIHTGDSYMYDSKTQEAGELEDFELPPNEELGGVSVAFAKPVCAVWIKAGKCKHGRRCPWRHCQPVAGDSIREPIVF